MASRKARFAAALQPSKPHLPNPNHQQRIGIIVLVHEQNKFQPTTWNGKQVSPPMDSFVISTRKYVVPGTSPHINEGCNEREYLSRSPYSGGEPVHL